MGFTVSCYAVRGMLIDAAFDDVAGEYMSWVRERKPAGVIVTHAHDDHAANADRLAVANVPTWIAPWSADYLRVSHPRGWHRKWVWGGMPVLKHDVTPFAPAGLEVIHTPGHSPDHHVVWDPSTETLFSADLFIGVKVRVAHPIEREDVRQQIGSIRRAIVLKPKRVFDAHRGLLKDGIGLLTAKANWLEQTVGEIDALIARGDPDRAIVKQVFGGEEMFAYTTFGDFSRINFVRSVRSTNALSRSPS